MLLLEKDSNPAAMPCLKMLYLSLSSLPLTFCLRKLPFKRL